MRFWAIRQISTGHYLPESNGGYTYTWPVPGRPPRLHAKRSAARRALTAWLKGKWHAKISHSEDWGPEQTDMIIIPEGGRNKEDMCVVCLVLTTVRDDD